MDGAGGWQGAREDPEGGRHVARGAPPLAGIAIVSLASFWLVEFAVARLAPELDEPLALRWLRAFVAHPVRSPLALALLLHGLRSLRREE
jgi:hypothetical protein